MPELLRLEHFGFTYPQQPRPALADVSLTVRQGEFWVLCGASGCGKTTLLRQLKPALRPHGAAEGRILFDGQPLDDLPPHQQAADIGFVLQSPEEQTVTDKVWHELAFGLESLGCDTPSIRRRVAEMASFFGIQDWFHKKVDELSGGQKQLLALASVMVLQPRLLILDESLFPAQPPLREEQFSSPLLGRAFALLWQAREDGRAVTPAVLSEALTPEEMSHISAVCQQPESPQHARQALADYIRIVQEESDKRAGRQAADPLLAATEKYKDKKGTGGKQHG